MATTEILNGVPQIFGPASANPFPVTTKLSDRPAVQKMVIDFDYANLPNSSVNDARIQLIPAYSLIVSARIETVVAFAGGTSYDIGLVQADGTTINLTGLYAALALASINTKGKWAAGAGALVGAGIGAAAGTVRATATGVFTAGQARLYIEYVPATAV